MTTDAADDPAARRVVFLAVPPVQLLDLVGPYEIFSHVAHALGEHNLASRRGYRVEVVSTERAPLVAGNRGLDVAAHGHYRDLRGPVDTLLVVGGEDGEGAVGALDPAALAWLREWAPRVRRLGAVCTGVFALAAAGLLDGRRVVTHWRWCDRLARDYPAVRVDAEPIYVRDGGVYTSAGVTAGMDLALALVEEDHGAAVALRVARELVLFLRRPGGQSQFSPTLARQGTDRRPLRDLHAWILDNLDRTLDGETLARQAAMSPRHFARVFAREVGTTPARYVEEARVGAARQQLEGTDASIADIATACGFGSADVMRRSFLRLLRVTPQEYRTRFHTGPGAGESGLVAVGSRQDSGKRVDALAKPSGARYDEAGMRLTNA